MASLLILLVPNFSRQPFKSLNEMTPPMHSITCLILPCGLQGTFCNVPSACDGVALADGTCCLYELSRSGVCCEVVDNDMECCESGVLDAAGVCQGTAVSIDYNGQTCTVRRCLFSLSCYGFRACHYDVWTRFWLCC